MANTAKENEFPQGDKRQREVPPRRQGQRLRPRPLQPVQIQCNVLFFCGKLCVGIVLPIHMINKPFVSLYSQIHYDIKYSRQ